MSGPGARRARAADQSNPSNRWQDRRAETLHRALQRWHIYRMCCRYPRPGGGRAAEAASTPTPQDRWPATTTALACQLHVLPAAGRAGQCTQLVEAASWRLAAWRASCGSPTRDGQTDNRRIARAAGRRKTCTGISCIVHMCHMCAAHAGMEYMSATALTPTRLPTWARSTAVCAKHTCAFIRPWWTRPSLPSPRMDFHCTPMRA